MISTGRKTLAEKRYVGHVCSVLVATSRVRLVRVGTAEAVGRAFWIGKHFWQLIWMKQVICFEMHSLGCNKRVFFRRNYTLAKEVLSS